MSLDKYPNISSRGGCCLYIPEFSKVRVLQKDLKENKHNSLQLAQNYARMFVGGH